LPAAISATLYTNVKFNLMRDIASVDGIERIPLVMLFNPGLLAKTVPDFISHAKANPDKIIERARAVDPQYRLSTRSM
jgi:tripartite-type tricarboxylate transporter receptor subunit TctC